MHDLFLATVDIEGFAKTAKTLSDGGLAVVCLFMLLLVTGGVGFGGTLLIRFLIKVLEREWTHIYAQLDGERAARVEIQRTHDEYLDKGRRETLVTIQESAAILDRSVRLLERVERMLDDKSH